MDWIIEPLHHIHVQRALAICVLVGFANGYMSAFVVLRKSALQVGSLSYSLLPGVAVGVLLFGMAQFSIFAGALFAALFVGLGSLMLSRTSRIGQETALAILYTTAFAAGIILFQFVPVNVEVDEFLFGNILFASAADLRTVFWVSSISMVVLTAIRRPLILALFETSSAQVVGVPVRAMNYLLFSLLALVLVASLQAVGSMLALGLLVTPAATVYLLTDRIDALFWGGGILGAVASVGALIFSHHFDLPSGACIIIALSSLFLLAWMFSPKYGLLSAWISRPSNSE